MQTPDNTFRRVNTGAASRPHPYHSPTPGAHRYKDYDPCPPRANTRWFSPQYKDRTKRYFNNVSPLNRPDKDAPKSHHPRQNLKSDKVSSKDRTALPNLPPSKSQGEITKIWDVKQGNFLRYRSCSNDDDEGYWSGSEGGDLPLSPQTAIPRRGRRSRGRDRRVVEVHLARSLAGLSLKPTFDLQALVAGIPAAGHKKRVVLPDQNQKISPVLPKKRKRDDPLFSDRSKHQKVEASVGEGKGQMKADSSTSATDVIDAIDLCLQSMAEVKVKDSAPPTPAQTNEAVNVSKRRRRWRRKEDKPSNTAESRRHISRVNEDPLDLG